MANQMIALQARGPQLPDVGAMNVRYANIMANMSAARQKQDEIARAAEFRRRAESGVDVLTPEGFNQLSGLDPQGAAALRKSALDKQKADAEFKLGYLSTVNKELQRANTPEQALAIGQSLKQAYPMFADNIDQTLSKMPTDPAQFPAYRRQINLSALDAAQRIEYEMAKVTAEKVIGEGGIVGVLTKGGDQAPTLEVAKTFKPDPMAGGTVDVEPAETVEGGVGGPDEGAMSMAPGDRSSRLSADLASPLMNVKNDAEYQVALQAINRVNPDAAAEIKQLMPRFDPARMEGIRAAAAAEFNVVPQAGPQGLVTGARGGVGGPREGYVESSTPFRARVPAPPSQPQPRETAEEVYAKEKARQQAKLDVEATAPPAPPKPLTEKDLRARRDKVAVEYRKAQGLLDKTYGKAGIIDTINAVRNLSRPQKEAITGYSGYIPSVLASSKDADTAIKNLQGTVTELGKEAAAATGAIGSMAVQEWTIVRNMIVNLDLEGMTAEGLERQLDIIEAKAKNAARLTQQAFDAQYSPELKSMPEFRLKAPGGAKSAPKPGSQYPVMTPEQVRKAPPGTKFRRADNGKVMEKL